MPTSLNTRGGARNWQWGLEVEGGDGGGNAKKFGSSHR